MKKLWLLFCVLPLANAAHVTILRDEYGVPHIFADEPPARPSAPDMRRPKIAWKKCSNYRRAEGTMAEAFGPEFFRDDCRQRLWRHRQVAEQHYKELSPRSREICEAFQAGVQQYMKEHPEQVPAWAPKLEPWQLVALGRYIIWGWPEGEAGGELHARRHPARPGRLSRLQRNAAGALPHRHARSYRRGRSAPELVRRFPLL